MGGQTLVYDPVAPCLTAPKHARHWTPVFAALRGPAFQTWPTPGCSFHCQNNFEMVLLLRARLSNH